MRPGKGYGREKNERAVAHTGGHRSLYMYQAGRRDGLCPRQTGIFLNILSELRLTEEAALSINKHKDPAGDGGAFLCGKFMSFQEGCPSG